MAGPTRSNRSKRATYLPVVDSDEDGVPDVLQVEFDVRYAPVSVAVNAQVAAYTLALTDANRAVEVTSGSAVDVTVPPNASVAFPIGTVIEVAQLGAGQVTILADTGVTVNSRGALVDIAGQYGAASLRKRGTDTWLLVGDLA